VIDPDVWLPAWNSQSPGPILELCDDDIEVHAVTLGIEGRHYTGHDGVRQWMRDIRDRFQARTVAESLTQLDDGAALLCGTLYSKDDTTGEELAQRFAMLIHLKDDKARWVGTFFSAADARAAYASGVTGPRTG